MDEREHDEEEDSDQGPPDLTNSQNDQTEREALEQRDVPPVLTVESSKENSSEDDETIR